MYKYVHIIFFTSIRGEVQGRGPVVAGFPKNCFAAAFQQDFGALQVVECRGDVEEGPLVLVVNGGRVSRGAHDVVIVARTAQREYGTKVVD
jgi:hypothetical protein